MTRRSMALVAALLLLPAIPQRAAAQDRIVVVQQEQPGIIESALAACAGGAVIGVLVVAYAGPMDAMGPTAGLFCGLSVAATVVSNATTWTWHTVTSVLP